MLSWSGQTGTGISYNIYRATLAGQENYNMAYGTTSTLSFTDTTSGGVTYYYTVKEANNNYSLTSPASAESNALELSRRADRLDRHHAGLDKLAESKLDSPKRHPSPATISIAERVGGEGGSPINGSPSQRPATPTAV